MPFGSGVFVLEGPNLRLPTALLLAKAGRSRNANSLQDPLADQIGIANTLGLGDLLDRIEFLRLEMNLRYALTLKDRLGHLFQLIFKISEVVCVPEGGQFLNRVGSRDLSSMGHPKKRATQRSYHVILSAAKDLADEGEILRFAQNDSSQHTLQFCRNRG